MMMMIMIMITIMSYVVTRHKLYKLRMTCLGLPVLLYLQCLFTPFSFLVAGILLSLCVLFTVTE